MKLATWNINSVRKRTPHICSWLQKETPDFLLLQELKCQTEHFPFETFKDLGYESYVVGQKSYNGVAVLTKKEVSVTHKSLPGYADEAARYIEVEDDHTTIGNLYAPNGNSGGEEGYQRKLEFMDSLTRHAEDLLKQEKDFLFAGDFNICPTDSDLASGTLSEDDALIRPPSRAAWRRLEWLGLTDGWRALYPEAIAYTFWGYQNMCWARNKGLRIDAFLLSPCLAERLTTATINKDERDKEQPSDHVPLVVEIN